MNPLYRNQIPSANFGERSLPAPTLNSFSAFSETADPLSANSMIDNGISIVKAIIPLAVGHFLTKKAQPQRRRK